MLKFLNSILIIFLLAACSAPSDDFASRDTILVATSADNPPYEFLKDREIVGLDIDIINAIGKELGKKIEIRNLSFPGLLPALNSGSVDAVIAGITVTEARKQNVDFSRGYVSTAMSVMFTSEKDWAGLEDLQAKKIGVQAGTTWEIYAKALQKRFPQIEITSLPSNLVLVESLKSGHIDAVIMEEMQIARFKSKVSDMKSFVLKDTQGEFAIAVQKGSGLAEQFNKAIDKLQLEGKLYPIKTKWLTLP